MVGLQDHLREYLKPICHRSFTSTETVEMCFIERAAPPLLCWHIVWYAHSVAMTSDGVGQRILGTLCYYSPPKLSFPRFTVIQHGPRIITHVGLLYTNLIRPYISQLDYIL